MLRACKLLFYLLACNLHLLLNAGRDLRTRSRLRQQWSRRILRALGLTLTVHGQPPASGVVVGNHLSYLDILAYGAVIEGVFLSKEEVRHWPLIGLATKLAGTIFINRRNKGALATVNEQIKAVLQQGLPMIFFPEGTTSDGTHILRFHAGLFQSAVDAGAEIWPAAIIYRLNGSSEGVSEKVCYWGDMDFAKHIWQFIKLNGVSAELRFASEPIRATERIDAAQRSQAEVAKLADLPTATKEVSAALLAQNVR